MNKQKFDYFLIIKWFIGLYIIGIFMNLTGKMVSNVSAYVYSDVITSNFFTVELVSFANFLREPLIPLIVTIPFFFPGAIIVFATYLVLNKIEIFPGKQKYYYIITLAFMLTIISFSTFILS